MILKWYIVHVHSGFEEKVKKNLQERIDNAGLQNKFGDIVVPTEQVIEIVKGKKKQTARKFYPGYMLVKMSLDEETWHLVNKTNKISGFIGSKSKPVPISEKEANQILSKIETGKEMPRPKLTFEIGDEVKVNSGPFTDFNGFVEEVNSEKGKLKVSISIFGRSTPVELDFIQVSKI